MPTLCLSFTKMTSKGNNFRVLHSSASILLQGEKRQNSLWKNLRFCLQVFCGDTVENSFSDVATSKMTWQRYRKFLTNPNFQTLLHRQLWLLILVRQGLQNCKKNINNLNFLAIHMIEQLPLLRIEDNNSIIKIIYLEESGIFVKPTVFLNHLNFRLNKNLNITSAWRNAV